MWLGYGAQARSLLIFLLLAGTGWRAIGAEPITSIEAIRALSPIEADRGLPVRVTGVITYLEPRRGLAFIQNGPHAVYVTPRFTLADQPEAAPAELTVGERVEILGITTGGSFAPAIREPPGGAVLVQREGRAGFPPPVRPARGNLMDPSLDGLWVEVDGVVRNVSTQRNRTVLEMASGRTIFPVILPVAWPPGRPLGNLLNASVRVRGVYGSVANERRQLIGLRIYSPNPRFVQVLDSGAEKMWDRKPLGVEELMQFRQATAERVRMQGQVTAVFPGEGVFLRTDGGSIRVATPQAGSVSVGQWVDAVGFPVMDGNRPALEDALLQPGALGMAPAPIPLRSAELLDPTRHGELVSVRATLLDRFVRGSETLLLLTDGPRTFTASLAAALSSEDLALHSLVELSGIVLIQTERMSMAMAEGNDGTRDSPFGGSFALVLRSPSDITVLRRPPFWTPDRLFLAFVAMAAGLMLAGAWLMILRRKVSEQTRIISEKSARQYVLEERARIARELHDTLEQELAGIGMQLDVAKKRLTDSDERLLRPVELALRMLRRCQSETRRSITNLRSVQLEGRSLESALKLMVEEQMSPGGPAISVTVSGTPIRLSATGEQHLLRFFQEGLTNALKHARARKIDLRLSYSPLGLLAEIEDDGVGFLLEECEGRAGHFGLRGMRERAAKLRGEFRVDTDLGQGTRIVLELPLRPRHKIKAGADWRTAQKDSSHELSQK